MPTRYDDEPDPNAGAGGVSLRGFGQGCGLGCGLILGAAAGVVLVAAVALGAMVYLSGAYDRAREAKERFDRENSAKVRPAP